MGRCRKTVRLNGAVYRCQEQRKHLGFHRAVVLHDGLWCSYYFQTAWERRTDPVLILLDAGCHLLRWLDHKADTFRYMCGRGRD